MKSGCSSKSHNSSEEPDNYGSRWFFSRREIDENSPSKKDGIDTKKEMYLRKSYCTFLQDLGMRLKVPQLAIATAIVFCHRFFLRQSHAKNDRRTIATVCMFLAGKVEENPRPLKDVIVVSYELIHKKDPKAIQKIKQKEVYEQQKELILSGEKVVLTTIGFDLNVQHPYKPLVDSIKKFKVAQSTLAQVAWNFVNDGLRTSLCLQFDHHHIAAGAIFLAAKFLKVKLPAEGDKVWWQEFGVTPRQLEDVSNQMLELYEQNRAGKSSHQNDPEGSTGYESNHLAKAHSTVSESSMSVNAPPRDSRTFVEKQSAEFPSSKSMPTPSSADNTTQSKFQNVHKHIKDEVKDEVTEPTPSSADNNTQSKFQNVHKNIKDEVKDEVTEPTPSTADSNTQSKFQNVHRHIKDEKTTVTKIGSLDHNKGKEIVSDRTNPTSFIKKEKTESLPPELGDVKDKIRANKAKRMKLPNDVKKKTDILDEDDLIEMELEDGIVMPAEEEKLKSEQSIGKRSTRDSNDGCEEGELSSLEEHDYSSPKRARS